VTRLENTDEVLVNHHPMEICLGRPCPIHNPSQHHMRAFPQHWRSDRGIMERICPHGVGHPDPDDQSPDHTHGCDGCCHPTATWCAHHGVMEEIREFDFVCGECWHRYRGPIDVIATELERWGVAKPFNEIWSCPLCSHDF
jgi:hypothetical protein